MSDEIIKLLIWAYKQFFLDASKTLMDYEKVLDEDKLYEQFKAKLKGGKDE